MVYIAFKETDENGISITNAVDDVNLAHVVVPEGVAYWLLSQGEVDAFTGVPQEQWSISRDTDGVSKGREYYNTL